ncbi:putative methyltransferase NSUN7 [Eucyclogobius newberryi]|uniref:putative methyltransferase NSUN7 n=1 Tax=Eucyclogobius newberryi TaxID=166745 RepID=UPI003B59F3AD
MEDDPVHMKQTASGQTLEGFADRVYLLASVIFQNNYLQKPAAQRLVNYGEERGLALPEVTDAEMQRAAYELAFNALKYQGLLENLLLDSSFYLTQPLPDDQMSLVVVMLFDFLDRKFLPRKCKNTDVKEVRLVELHLLRFTAKLAASLARWRIKYEILTIECMLPETVRIKQERASSLMLYAWVNSLKSSLDEVHSVLKRAGFSRVRSIGQLQAKTFCQDPHCEDTLVFPAEAKAQLNLTSLHSNHKLIVQDKACCLGPNAVRPLLQEAENGDVLMAGCFSGLTVSHTASLIAMKQKNDGNDKSNIFVCVGDQTEPRREKLQQVVNATGCKNVKLIPESFQSLDKGDQEFRKVRVILLAPKSSLTAISNPIEFILQEDGDTELLQDLAQGSIAKSKLEALVVQQKKDIDHAMQFPTILSVIYTTYSSQPEENEDVVRAVFEQARACGESSPSQTSLCPFTSPLDSEDLIFMLEPTEHNNGCFMAIFTREAPQKVQDPVTDDPAEVAKTTGKPPCKRSQARLKRRETKSSSGGSGSGTYLKKSAVRH